MSYTDTKTINVALSGVGPHAIDVSAQYTCNQISVDGVATGAMTIRVKTKDKTTFENVDGGSVDLTQYQTLTIEKASVKQVEVTVVDGGNYNLIINQSNLVFGMV